MARGDDKRFYVVDVVRGQWSAMKREERLRETAVLDRATYGQVTIWVEQEPGSGGKESAEATLRSLAGYGARAERVTGDKATRAQPLATAFEAMNIWMVKADWNGRYVEELTGFPTGTYKDQVDASSGAFNKLAVDGWKMW
jgi:predicted phage terminase large subunit-like protein